MESISEDDHNLESSYINSSIRESNPESISTENANEFTHFEQGEENCGDQDNEFIKRKVEN